MPPDLGERIAVLERRAVEVEGRLGRIEGSLSTMQEQIARVLAKVEELPTRKELAGLTADLAAMRTKIDHLPTWLQIMGLVGGTVVLSTAFYAFANNATGIIQAWRAPTTPISAPAPSPASR